MGDWHVLTQTAHGRHLVAVDGMDDTSSTEEEQGLKHGVGEEMEHGGHVTETSRMFVPSGDFGADTEGHHHEGNLRDG